MLISSLIFLILPQKKFNKPKKVTLTQVKINLKALAFIKESKYYFCYFAFTGCSY